jgi:hypothetical protein
MLSVCRLLKHVQVLQRVSWQTMQELIVAFLACEKLQLVLANAHILGHIFSSAGLLQCFLRFLQAQGIVHILVVSPGLTLLLHLLLCPNLAR